MTLDVAALRAQFPALHRPAESGALPVYFDGPGGTQVPQRVIDAVADYFVTMNANHGGAFATSRRSDAMVYSVRGLVADFLNAARPEEIVFGPNMTTLSFALSRAVVKTLAPGDEVVVTRMDHDANITPWTLAAADRGLAVRWVDIDVEDCTLRLDSLAAALSDRTRVVATIHASNAVGTINPAARIAAMAHAAGAVYVLDAVHSAPHIPLDVSALGCDFLLCSAYKFFGPHIGILWGRHDLLTDLPAYKVRPADDAAPHRWEMGTANFEGLAGVAAAIAYLTEIGAQYGGAYAGQFPGLEGRRLRLKQALAAVSAYERDLFAYLLAGLKAIPGLHIYGITDPARFDERTPTVAFTLEGHTPHAVAEHLAAHDIYVWDGNYYALAIMERLGLQASGGAVRVGLAHYNTRDEIDRLLAALRRL